MKQMSRKINLESLQVRQRLRIMDYGVTSLLWQVSSWWIKLCETCTSVPDWIEILSHWIPLQQVFSHLQHLVPVQHRSNIVWFNISISIRWCFQSEKSFRFAEFNWLMNLVYLFTLQGAEFLEKKRFHVHNTRWISNSCNLPDSFTMIVKAYLMKEDFNDETGTQTDWQARIAATTI